MLPELLHAAVGQRNSTARSGRAVQNSSGRAAQNSSGRAAHEIYSCMNNLTEAAPLRQDRDKRQTR